jgi:thymidylate synthase
MYNCISDIRNKFIYDLGNENFVIDKSGVKMLEIIGASFPASEQSIFGEPNEEYIQREIDWYKSLSLNVDDIPGKTPAIWNAVADPYGWVNSNYGWCVWSSEANCSKNLMKNKHNFGQYSNVIETLKNHRESRQAIMIYTRPSMHKDAVANGMSDFICTNTVQYLIRDDHLSVIVNMRSNDVIFGYRNDKAWQDYVAGCVIKETGCHSYSMLWNVGSLHVYSRHFDLVK